MMTYTRSAIGLLTRQYRSVLKKCFLINCGLFALGVVSARAATVTPTLDDMNSKAASFSTESHYNLTTPKGTNTHFLVLDNGSGTMTTYWYTPAEGTAEKDNILNYLTDVALIQTDSPTDYVFETPNGTHYTFDMSKPRPVSAYTLAATETPQHWRIDIDGTTYDLEMRGRGTGNQNLYFKWTGSSANHKLTNGTSDSNDLVVKVSAGTGDTNVYYKWTTDTEGNLELTTSDASETNYDLIANHDATSHSRITGGSGEDVTGDFFNLSDQNYGNAIYLSSGSLGNITGDFINNYASSIDSYAFAGAIYNKRNINSITGDFINNYAAATSGDASGGAIFNIKRINSITGDFINNHASSINMFVYGGAIYNEGTISSIIGDFINNHASSINMFVYGGAICNFISGTTNNITGDFINNYASSIDSYAFGGAIHNEGIIRSITGDFINNYASAVSNSAKGGAIYNNGYRVVRSITGDFINNYAVGNSGSGGAIDSYREINSITGDFINNYAAGNSAYGGAICNSDTISSIIGDFINNYAAATSGNAYGGAIRNSGINGTISSITGDFINDYALSTGSEAYGGAIYNEGTITLSGNTFTGNYIQKGTNTPIPNAIYNKGTINIAAGATVTVNDGWQSSDNSQLVMLGSDSVLNMNIGNGTIQQDSLGKITNVGTINATVDIDLSDIDNPLADTIQVTSVTQEGVINIKSLKFLSGEAQDIIDQELKIQILKYAATDEKLKLVADDSIRSGTTPKVISETVTDIIDNVGTDTAWTDSATAQRIKTTVEGILDVATTTTTDDSIGFKVTNVEIDEEQSLLIL